jgi:hypothetical protein
VSVSDLLCLVLLVYRPDSKAATSDFFAKLVDVLHRVSILSTSLIVAGDFNIRCDRPSDASAVQLKSLFASHGLACRVREPTRDRGGTLDVVATRDDLPAPVVDVIDADLSDHHLLRWPMTSARPSPTHVSFIRRPWRRVNVDDLRAAILASRLAQPALLPDDADVDALAGIYDADMLAIADRQAPARTVTVRCRSSDPWFDDECRAAKRAARAAERIARRSSSAANIDEWRKLRRDYRALRSNKREAFWRGNGLLS